MMNDDSWRAYSERLVTGDVLAREGYGKGLPVFLPWGIAVIRRLATVFAEEFSRGDTLSVRSPTTLVASDVYDRQVEDFGGYDNIYRVRWAGREYVVRPDCAVDNLAQAMRTPNNGRAGSVLSVFQGFRRLKGPTPPLFRDCAIWPFVQLNRVAACAERQQTVAQIVGSLQQLFHRLCLPVRIVRMGPWKNYSPDLYNVVLVTPFNTPTIVAMFFVVGESYRRMAGVPGGFDAFDVGLTEKILSVLLLCSPGEDGLVLPSSLAPVHVVVATDDGRVPIDDDGSGLIVRVEPLGKKDWWRKWARRGVPVLVEHARGRTRMKTRTGRWREVKPGCAVTDLVLEADAALRAYLAAARDASSLFSVRCESCARGDGLRGEVVPEEDGPCVSCGGPGRLRFITSLATIY